MSFSQDVADLCQRMRRRQLEGSLPCAKAAAELLRTLVTSRHYSDAQSLLDIVRSTAVKLERAKPLEVSVANMVRRVLHMIREESQQEVEEEVIAVHRQAVKEHEVVPGLLSKAFRAPRSVSLHNLLDQPARSLSVRDVSPLTPVRDTSCVASPDDDSTEAAEAMRRRAPRGGWQGRQSIIEQINELIDELVDIESNIAIHAVEHIHANEVILTFGYSHTTLLFLTEASKKRDFQVVVAEGAPLYGGHQMARELAQAGIITTAITDSAIFAMMARVNKVLVGAHAILANGGVISRVGSHLVALAAKRFSVPFVVLAGLHKLSPLFPHDPSLTFNDIKSPSTIIDYGVVSETMDVEFDAEADASVSKEVYVHVTSPMFDYVPPELVSLFVTDTGGFTPSYVYRLLAEYYSREDYTLSKQSNDLVFR